MSFAKIKLYSTDALRILAALDEQATEASIQLVTPATENPDPTPSVMLFDLWANGSETAHSLYLRSDGTWAMATHIEI